jgi:SpoVK/Ycf46/Vps4 family AAA+-type ATPase
LSEEAAKRYNRSHAESRTTFSRAWKELDALRQRERAEDDAPLAQPVAVGAPANHDETDLSASDEDAALREGEALSEPNVGSGGWGGSDGASPSRSQAVAETMARQTPQAAVQRRPERAPREVEAVLPNETGKSPVELAQVVKRNGSSGDIRVPAKERTQGRNAAETGGVFSPESLVEPGAGSDATEVAPGSERRGTSAPFFDVPYDPLGLLSAEDHAEVLAGYRAIVQKAFERT